MMTQEQYRAEALKALARCEGATTPAEKRSWAASACSWTTLAETAQWQDAFAVSATPFRA